MKRVYPLLGTLCLIAGTAPLWAQSNPYDPPPKCSRTPVDLVICLDTSGSMTALIDSARAELWDIVNQVARMQPTPHLRVGLFTYGSPNRACAAQGYVVRQTDLTNDLDTVYARMMAMSTNGGEEFVGWVLNDAIKTMSWSTDPRAKKFIFVCGNESADQAAHVFNFRSVAELARAKGIVIHSIFAGDRQAGVREMWQEVALHGGGTYEAIDMNEGTHQIAAPQDKILIELNARLNATYIPYGHKGRAGWENQQEQDRNAALMGEQAAGGRIAAKATAVYSNESWDLVDAVASGNVKVEDVADDQLPESMQKMTVKQRKTHVEETRKTRVEIQRRIQEVNEEREKHIEKERQRRGSQSKSLGQAVRQALAD
jgi:hypothetical protein